MDKSHDVLYGIGINDLFGLTVTQKVKQEKSQTCLTVWCGKSLNSGS